MRIQRVVCTNSSGDNDGEGACAPANGLMDQATASHHLLSLAAHHNYIEDAYDHFYQGDQSPLREKPWLMATKEWRKLLKEYLALPVGRCW